MEIFSEFLWCVFLKKNAKTKTNEFSKSLTGSKGRPSKLESARRTEFYNSLFQHFLKRKKYISLFKNH